MRFSPLLSALSTPFLSTHGNGEESGVVQQPHPIDVGLHTLRTDAFPAFGAPMLSAGQFHSSRKCYFLVVFFFSLCHHVLVVFTEHGTCSCLPVVAADGRLRLMLQHVSRACRKQICNQASEPLVSSTFRT